MSDAGHASGHVIASLWHTTAMYSSTLSFQAPKDSKTIMAEEACYMATLQVTVTPSPICYMINALKSLPMLLICCTVGVLSVFLPNCAYSVY